MAMEVSKEQWVGWRDSPVTQEFAKRMFDKRELLKEGLAEGQAANYDIVVGQCQAYKDVIEYTLEVFEVIDSEE